MTEEQFSARADLCGSATGLFRLLRETAAASLDAVAAERRAADTYCRLKNLTVGYTLPVKWLSKIHVQKARLYFSGENLLTLDRLDTDYIDPEAG